MSSLYTCQGCGAHLALAQLTGTDCPYCRAVFPHHARAAEQAALVSQVMAQNVAAFSPWIIARPMNGLAYGVGMTHVATDITALSAHAGGPMDSVFRRTQQAILVAVAASIGLAVLATVLSAALLS